MDELILFVVVCLLALPIIFLFDTYIISYDIQIPIFMKRRRYIINWFGENMSNANSWKMIENKLGKLWQKIQFHVSKFVMCCQNKNACEGMKKSFYFQLQE